MLLEWTTEIFSVQITKGNSRQNFHIEKSPWSSQTGWHGTTCQRNNIDIVDLQSSPEFHLHV